jgi:hypothetical protein
VSEPVSWYLVEPGWEVVDRHGEEVGTVLQVAGDLEADIFDGLRVRPRRGDDDLFVEADRVARIFEGRIELDTSHAGLQATDSDPPGGVELRRDRSQDP